jgi:hypothetical protein
MTPHVVHIHAGLAHAVCAHAAHALIKHYYVMLTNIMHTWEIHSMPCTVFIISA